MQGDRWRGWQEKARQGPAEDGERGTFPWLPGPAPVWDGPRYRPPPAARGLGSGPRAAVSCGVTLGDGLPLPEPSILICQMGVIMTCPPHTFVPAVWTREEKAETGTE